jgi:hypothetical protein
METEIGHISRDLQDTPEVHLEACHSRSEAATRRETSFEGLWPVGVALSRRCSVSDSIEEVNEREGFCTACFPIDNA